MNGMRGILLLAAWNLVHFLHRLRDKDLVILSCLNRTHLR